MTEVIERVLKTFEVISTADCFRMTALCFGSTLFLQNEMFRKNSNFLSKLLFLGFEKLNFSDFWGPLELQCKAKCAQILDSGPLSMP